MTEVGGVGSRRLIRSISARSPGERGPRLSREVNGPRLPDHRDLDLTGVLELVLDPPGDILRQPDRGFVGDAIALDHDPDFAPGLKGEGFRDAFERIGDPFQFLERLTYDSRMSRRAPGRAEEMASAAWTSIASSDGQSISM
jgi:hypothetical protein